MACKNPINIFKPGQGKIWNETTKQFGEWTQVTCGKCAWCRFVRSRQWAARCYLEAQTHEKCCLVNLTYAPEHVPKNDSLVKSDLQKFLKRLRHNLDYSGFEGKIRFYASGEYGDQNGRPHYHVLIFGYDFPDKKYYKKSAKGFPLYRSDFLEKCWKLGFSDIGDVSLQSAAYVAKYIRKKIVGKDAESHYSGRTPEFQLASTNPGIGYEWYQQNKNWLWHEDIIRINGRSYRPPQYFQMLLKEENPEGYLALLERKQNWEPITNRAPSQAEEIPNENEAEQCS